MAPKPKKDPVCAGCPDWETAKLNKNHVSNHSKADKEHQRANEPLWWAFHAQQANSPSFVLTKREICDQLLDLAQNQATVIHTSRNGGNHEAMSNLVFDNGSGVQILVTKDMLDAAWAIHMKPKEVVTTIPTGASSQSASSSSAAAPNPAPPAGGALQPAPAPETTPADGTQLQASSSSAGPSAPAPASDFDDVMSDLQAMQTNDASIDDKAKSSGSSIPIATQPKVADRLCADEDSHRAVRRTDVLGWESFPSPSADPPGEDPCDALDKFPSLKFLNDARGKSKGTDEPQVLRPGLGHSGDKIRILTNHFRVEFPEDKTLYEYRVLGLEGGLTRSKRRVLILDMIEHDADLYDHRNDLATDYFDKIISYVPLIGDDQTPIDTTGPGIPVDSYQPGTRNLAPARLDLCLELKAKHALNGLRDFVSGSNEMYKDTGTAEAMKIIIAKAISDPTDPGREPKIFQSGKNRFYFRPGYTDLSEVTDRDSKSTGIIATRGYFSSIRPARGAVLLNVNLVAGAFHRPASLADYFQWMQAKNLRLNPDAIRHKLSAHLSGLRVWVNFERAYYKGNDAGVDSVARRTKTLCELGKKPKEQTEQDSNGKPFTIWDHLTDKYDDKGGAP